jgi:uncharacterized protein (TIGR02246 family)
METQLKRDEEQAVRKVVADWLEASKRGDLDTQLSLMADDVVFMTVGQEPFGKEEFKARSKGLGKIELEANSNIIEVKLLSDWAWMRSHLEIKVTMPDGNKMQKAGYILTVLQQQSNGSRVISRDANLLT